jgi:hypothetical protein
METTCPRSADAGRLVTGGVDTHAEMHVAGMVDQAGRVLATREFASKTPRPKASNPRDHDKQNSCWQECQTQM